MEKNMEEIAKIFKINKTGIMQTFIILIICSVAGNIIHDVIMLMENIGLVEKDYTELFAKADEALYESKHAGKSCYSEYGVKLDGRKASKIIPVITRSRNVISIIEFVHESSYDIRILKCSLNNSLIIAR
jgi:GGDEF domain-containing protein